jgi:hypothetical protein
MVKLERPLRPWKWYRLPIYNGFAHEDRVSGWQLHWQLIEDGHLPLAISCCISGSTQKVQYHSENYYEPWNAYPVSQPIHLALHRRFSKPEAWKSVLEQYSVTGQEWFALLEMTPINLAAELRAAQGRQVANIFDRAPGRY